MRYNNRFFATKEDAKKFQKEHCGALYANTPRSRTRLDFTTEMMVAWDARREAVDAEKTPYCVAWNERD